ncbi:MAG TPA: hypothetical protein VHG08_09685 [Longimicrobium sp.]|nr:hypothetical protein [Longimicrobium sp.]
MRRVPVSLSSELTPLFKFGFPVLFGIVAGLMTFLVPAGEGDPGAAGRVLLWLGMIVLLLWACGGLMAVRQEGTDLVISNYRREHRVPASQIERVRRFAGMVVIRFRQPTPFGRSIRFVPEASLLDVLGLGWMDDEPVKHLRELARMDAGRRQLRDGQTRSQLEGS